METFKDNSEITSVSVTAATSPRRVLRFDALDVRQPATGSFTCSVTLSGPRNRVYKGEGNSLVSGLAMTAAARATLRAIEVYAGTSLTLVSIRKTQVGMRDLVLVIVSVSSQPRAELTGAVIVHGDESRAAALAVLDATNRWLEMHNAQRYRLPAGLHEEREEKA